MSTPGAQSGMATRLRMGTYGLTPDQNLVAYLRPGIFLWQPPRGLSAVRVTGISGGSGGGSGRLDATSIAKGGGAGGGAGGAHDLLIPMHGDIFAGSRNTPWLLTVPAGGAGGAARSGVAIDGVAGTAGGVVRIDLPRPAGTGTNYAITASASSFVGKVFVLLTSAVCAGKALSNESTL